MDTCSVPTVEHAYLQSGGRNMQRRRWVNLCLLSSVATIALAASATFGPAQAQTATDPGVRGGAAGAGKPFAKLTANELAFFNNTAAPVFQEVEDVPNNGLGPLF